MKFRHFPRIVLFLVIFMHITVLDFFFVTPSGITLMPVENSRPITIIVHLLIAIATLAVYVLSEKVGNGVRSGKLAVREPILILSSVVMLFAIGSLLLEG